MNPLHSIASVRFSINTIRKSRSLVRLLALLGLVSIAAITLAATSSSATVFGPIFTRVATVFGSNASAPETRAIAERRFSPALHSAESAQPLSPTSAMATERRGHTATRLSDGRVLIAGGENSNGVLNQTEIYDATTDTFSAGSNMNDARVDHTATLLSDGRVLIAGGRNSAGALSTTEIFNPTTGSFSSGPSMSVARAGHSATLFADGRILFAGGDAGGSAEILDAVLSSSTPAGPLGTARSMHSAALMQDGSVLIVGGRDAGGNDLSSGEIFNGASFSAVSGSLTVARVRPLLRVLFDGKVQIIGGSNDGSMEIYDPQIQTFGAYAHVQPEGDTCVGLPAQVQASQTRAALFHNGQTDATFDRTSHSMTELGSQAIVVGGVNSDGAVLGSTPTFASSATAISTDKLDYRPGETAHISGRGFQPGETVRLKIHEDPHTPLERGMDVIADPAGNFVGDYVVQAYDLAMKFLVGARGLTSGFVAQTTFTDGALKIKSITWPSSASPRTFGVTVQSFIGSTNCTTGGGAISSGTADINGFNTGGIGGETLGKLSLTLTPMRLTDHSHSPLGAIPMVSPSLQTLLVELFA
jgi:WD40 repeat protein